MIYEFMISFIYKRKNLKKKRMNKKQKEYKDRRNQEKEINLYILAVHRLK